MTLVRLQDAGKQYGDRWIIRNVGFHVAQGERWGIMGRNGRGKTTLLRLLTGEEEPCVVHLRPVASPGRLVMD